MTLEAERLQKILSRAGVASRREAERMIEAGRVRVNGRTVTALGTRAEAGRDAIVVDGRLLRPAASAERVTYALHKPRGVVSTRKDPEGRPTVVDFSPPGAPRLYPIGRLDWDAEGLILLTNDGDLAFQLLRPGSAERVYHVKVKGQPEEESLERLRSGLSLDGRRTLPAHVRRMGRGGNVWIEVGLHEGRKNQLVRMFRAVGHPVLRLRRVRIGPVELGKLAPGATRRLTAVELSQLRHIRPGRRPVSARRPS